MHVLGYGEDALTLWALQNRLEEILDALGGECEPSDCVILYRPSFGRRGQIDGPQLGEFDFALLTPKRLYLGESKWDGSGSGTGAKDGLELKSCQLRRHAVFHTYVHEWFRHHPSDWTSFRAKIGPTLPCDGVDLKVPSAKDRLARNLQDTLRLIERHCGTEPGVCDVLLYLRTSTGAVPSGVAGAPWFKFVPVDCIAGMDRSWVLLRL